MDSGIETWVVMTAQEACLPSKPTLDPVLISFCPNLLRQTPSAKALGNEGFVSSYRLQSIMKEKVLQELMPGAEAEALEGC